MESRILSWWASYSSLLGNIFSTNWSKLGSGLRDLFETSFLRQVGHSLLPDLKAVTIHSAQNLGRRRGIYFFCNQRLKIGSNWLDLYLWRHSFVVIVFVSISRQIGQVSSLCKLRAETAISVSSVMASWGVRCSSYSERSQDLSIGSVLVMIDALIWNALSDV